jgi:hypothetical protein
MTEYLHLSVVKFQIPSTKLQTNSKSQIPKLVPHSLMGNVIFLFGILVIGHCNFPAKERRTSFVI